MRDFFERLLSAIKICDSVLCTIIESSGSTPRGAGARMLVTQEDFFGTVGGGAVEFAAINEARGVLSSGQGLLHTYNLTASDAEDLGMVCGGRVGVCFTCVPRGDAHFSELARRAVAAFNGTRDVYIIMDVTDVVQSKIGLYYEGEGVWGIDCENAEKLVKGALNEDFDGRSYYCERLFSGARALIFGAGHVSRALVPVMSGVGFNCVVLDDRPDLLKTEFFPDASELICCDLERISDSVTVTERDYIVIVTRGHRFDYALQRQVLGLPASYIGCIGSRRKVEAIRETLRADGVSEAEINRCVSPIGIDISAETPAEIAISITAQLIEHRAQK